MPALLSMLLPRKRAIEEIARKGLIECGVEPDAIAWRVDAEGRFVFGRKHSDDTGLTLDQVERIVDWARRERIKVGFLAWENGAS